MFATSQMMGLFPPDVAGVVKTANKKYTSDEIKKLDGECHKLVADMRVKQKQLDKTLKEHLRSMEISITHFEGNRTTLLKLATEIYGYEAIMSRLAADKAKAEKAGKADKVKDLEGKLKKNAEQYAQKMRSASQVSNSIQKCIDDLEATFGLLAKAGASVPRTVPSQFKSLLLAP